MKTICLIGGNGFIGSHLASALSPTWKVRTFDRDGSTHHGIGEFVAGDVSSGHEREQAVNGCAAMIYLIHETRSGSPFLDPEEVSLLRNLELFMGVLQTCESMGVENIGFFSSGGAVYGRSEAQTIRESHPLNPISAYGVAKAAMEIYLQAAATTKGFKTLIFRPSNPYGPGQNPIRQQGAVAVFSHKILTGVPVDVWGDGSAIKDYIYIDDLVSGVSALINSGFDGKAYNVGSGEGITVRQLVEIIAQISGNQPKVNYSPGRKDDVCKSILDITALRERTGWKPAIPLRAGIEKTMQWIQKNFIETAQK